MTNAKMTLTVNDHNTLFVYMDGHLIADSYTFRRRRFFNNKLTGACVPAKGCTPRKVRANPEMVIGLLCTTGLECTGSVTLNY